MSATNTDELIVLAETLADLRTRFEKVETEFGTQAKPLEAATTALAAALSGIKALQFHILENNLGALSARVEDQRKAIDEQVSAIALELKKADAANADKTDAAAQQLRGELSAIGNQLSTLRESFTRETERIQLSAQRELTEKLAAVPAGPAGPAGRSLNPTGSYAADRAYQRLDIVSFMGGSFVSNEDDNREKPGPKSKKWTMLVARPPSLSGGTVAVQTAVTTVPASASSAGTVGQIAYGGGYRYDCIATNTWRRSPITSF